MKKKVFLLLSPVLILTGIFLGLHVWLNRHPGYGALQVTSRPEATVYLNGRPLGKTPMCIGQADCIDPKPLVVKEYTLKLVPKDTTLSPFEEKIKIEKSVLTVVDRIFASGTSSETTLITLQKLGSKENEILVLTTPDKSDVFLDSNPVGQTPLVLKNQTISDHELKISKSGYKEKTIRVRTVAGYRLATTIQLGVDEKIGLSNNATDSAVLSATNSAQVSPTVEPIKKVLVLPTPNGFLRVRSQPSRNASEIGRVKDGEVLDLVAEKPDWFQIKMSDGEVGWVSTQYAKIQN